MHGLNEGTMGLAGVSLGRELRVTAHRTRAGIEHARHAVAWLEGRVRLFNRSFGSTMKAPEPQTAIAAFFASSSGLIVR